MVEISEIVSNPDQEFKETPTPGYWYIVKPISTDIPDTRGSFPGQQFITGGEWISNIAIAAYAGKMMEYPRIMNDAKNAGRVCSAPIQGKTQHFFYPGDPIYIPRLDGQSNDKIKADRNSFTLIIEGKKVKIETGALIRTMDTLSDGWEVSFPWVQGKEPELDRLTAPRSFKDCQVYIGGSLQASGYVYNVKHRTNKDGRSKVLSCYSKTIDIVDSNMEPPFTFRDFTLKGVLDAIAAKHGILVSVMDGIDLSKKFAATKAYTIADKEFEFIARLAERRGVLLSNDEQGNLLVQQASPDKTILGTVKEEQPVSQEYEVEFKGREMFSTYYAYDRDPAIRMDKTRSAQRKGYAIVEDAKVPGKRVMSFSAYELENADLQIAALWQKNKSLVEGLSIPFPVASWYDPWKDNLWRSNTLINVISPTIGTSEKGYIFRIRAVKFIYSARGGRSSILYLVPPLAYTRDKQDLLNLGSLW